MLECIGAKLQTISRHFCIFWVSTISALTGLNDRETVTFSATWAPVFQTFILILSALLTGATTNVCVHYTGADAHQNDYRIKVVEEATAGTSIAAHNAALEALQYLQHGARVHIDDVLQEMKSFKHDANHVKRKIRQMHQWHQSSLAAGQKIGYGLMKNWERID